MEIIYKANDGTLFDNEFDCLQYEEAKTYGHIYFIEFFTKFDNKYFITKDNLFKDCNYNICEKLIIHNQNEFLEFFKWADYCGWCEFYEQIDSPGIWVRTEEENTCKGKWTKIAAI